MPFRNVLGTLLTIILMLLFLNFRRQIVKEYKKILKCSKYVIF